MHKNSSIILDSPPFVSYPRAGRRFFGPGGANAYRQRSSFRRPSPDQPPFSHPTTDANPQFRSGSEKNDDDEPRRGKSSSNEPREFRPAFRGRGIRGPFIGEQQPSGWEQGPSNRREPGPHFGPNSGDNRERTDERRPHDEDYRQRNRNDGDSESKESRGNEDETRYRQEQPKRSEQGERSDARRVEGPKKWEAAEYRPDDYGPSDERHLEHNSARPLPFPDDPHPGNSIILRHFKPFLI